MKQNVLLPRQRTHVSEILESSKVKKISNNSKVVIEKDLVDKKQVKEKEIIENKVGTKVSLKKLEQKHLSAKIPSTLKKVGTKVRNEKKSKEPIGLLSMHLNALHANAKPPAKKSNTLTIVLIVIGSICGYYLCIAGCMALGFAAIFKKLMGWGGELEQAVKDAEAK